MTERSGVSSEVREAIERIAAEGVRTVVTENRRQFTALAYHGIRVLGRVRERGAALMPLLAWVVLSRGAEAYNHNQHQGIVAPAGGEDESPLTPRRSLVHVV